MNNLNIVIQCLIYHSDQPITGYDIFKTISSKTGNSHQQIYRELAKLALRDDIEVNSVPQEGKPDKKTYQFVGKNCFGHGFKLGADFSKSSTAYALFYDDIRMGTNKFDDYINELNAVEAKFKEMV